MAHIDKAPKSVRQQRATIVGIFMMFAALAATIAIVSIRGVNAAVIGGSLFVVAAAGLIWVFSAKS